MKHLKRFNEMTSYRGGVNKKEALIELFDQIEDPNFKQKWKEFKNKLEKVTNADIDKLKAAQTELLDTNEGFKDSMKKLGRGVIYSVGRLTNYITRVLGFSGLLLSLFTLAYGLLTYFVQTNHNDIVTLADREKFDFFFNILPSMKQYSVSGLVGSLLSFILIMLGEIPMIPYRKTMMDKVLGDEKLIPDWESL